MSDRESLDDQPQRRQLSLLRCITNIQVKKHTIIANSFSQLHRVYTHPVTSLVKYSPVGFNCRYNSYERSNVNLDVAPWDNLDDDSREYGNSGGMDAGGADFDAGKLQFYDDKKIFLYIITTT
ncbi:hypothetical protein PV326_002250 [Microctonus aethiopoides]|nr:hypothetical protein PV326_002250 [Microctonus aethiopoides]